MRPPVRVQKVAVKLAHLISTQLGLRLHKLPLFLQKSLVYQWTRAFAIPTSKNLPLCAAQKAWFHCWVASAACRKRRWAGDSFVGTPRTMGRKWECASGGPIRSTAPSSRTTITGCSSTTLPAGRVEP